MYKEACHLVSSLLNKSTSIWFLLKKKSYARDSSFLHQPSCFSSARAILLNRISLIMSRLKKRKKQVVNVVTKLVALWMSDKCLQQQQQQQEHSS